MIDGEGEETCGADLMGMEFVAEVCRPRCGPVLLRSLHCCVVATGSPLEGFDQGSVVYQ